MERLDKVISNYTKYTRSEVKTILKKKKIQVNGVIIKEPNLKIDIKKDEIKIENIKLIIKKKIYLVLNKPKGYISATRDRKVQTVLDLISDEYRNRGLVPVGRLDKDTSGLMILTNDGEFVHRVLAPKNNHKKIYIAKIDIPITLEMKKGFKEGIKLNDGKCKSSKLEQIDEFTAFVTLTEGRYHQIKRMFGCYGANVIELKRIQIGEFKLPKELEEGQYREMTENEINMVESK